MVINDDGIRLSAVLEKPEDPDDPEKPEKISESRVTASSEDRFPHVILSTAKR